MVDSDKTVQILIANPPRVSAFYFPPLTSPDVFSFCVAIGWLEWEYLANEIGVLPPFLYSDITVQSRAATGS